MHEPLLEVVKETHLSRKPAQGSALVALGSVAMLLVTSTVCWLDPALEATLAATPEAIFERGEYWRLLTAIATHADFLHFLSNGVALGILSYLLYGYYGPWVYPVWSWALGSAAMGLAVATYPPGTFLVGASGVVYLMAGFWLTLYLFIERRVSMSKRWIRAVGFGLIVLMPTVLKPSVSYRSHAIGFGIGLGFGVGYYLLKKRDFCRAERVEWE